MTLRDTIQQWVAKTLSVESDFTLEYPGNSDHGDFSANIAMIEAKKEKKNPRELAGEYVEKLMQHRIPEVTSVAAAGPGFINFTISPHVFEDVVSKTIQEGVNIGEQTHFSGQEVLVEFGSTNPFKEFHAGHMMNNVIGESVARILEAHGSEVIRLTYHSDVGLHVAKAIWGLQNMEVGDEIDEKILGKAYATGAKLFAEDEDVKKEIIALNKIIYEKSDDEINRLYDIGVKVSMQYFELVYKRLGSTFDHHFYESQSAPIGAELVEEFLGKGIFEKSDGAVIFPGEKYGLHTRVFLTSEGLPTYEAKEIGLMQLKEEKYAPFDLSITVTANEQDAFFNVTECAIGQIFPNLTGKLKHLSHGMLKLPSGKMSSRTGDVITAEWLIDSVKNSALAQIHERIISDTERENIAELVALAALKFTILRQAIGGDIVFDLEKALSFEGDSGPYLQYATVRAATLLRKAKGQVAVVPVMPHEWKTTHLERLMQRYPHVVVRAGAEYAPHHIVTYLTELAGEFNSFYASHKIIDATDPTSGYRLALTEAFVNVMTAGLTLLGIEVPPEM